MGSSICSFERPGTPAGSGRPAGGDVLGVAGQPAGNVGTRVFEGEAERGDVEVTERRFSGRRRSGRLSTDHGDGSIHGRTPQRV
jgi:hypothetical protein